MISPQTHVIAPSSSGKLRLLLLGSFAVLALHCSSNADSGGDDGDDDEAADEAGGGEGGGDGGQGKGGAGGTSGAGGGGTGGVGGGGAGGSVAGQGGMTATGGTSSAGAGGVRAGGMGGAAIMEDKRPSFSFFVTSQAGIVSFATDKAKGLGGDLGGLAGADDKCTKLAQKSNPGDKKVWRAFLSARMGPNGAPVHAIERIGKGPWYNFKNVLLAKNVQDLVPGAGDNGRPTYVSGAEENRSLLEMFTDENGDPVSPDTNVVDNHDMLTGSDANGRLAGDTCKDWTSSDGSANGKPNIGHAWPRSADNGRHWIFDHQAGGCAAGMDTRKIANNGSNTVGAGGGYGGFYCFAVTGN